MVVLWNVVVDGDDVLTGISPYDVRRYDSRTAYKEFPKSPARMLQFQSPNKDIVARADQLRGINVNYNV